MELQSNNHSVFRLNYHLIMCTKYRAEVLTDKMSNRLREIFEYISPPYNISLKQWEHDKDHIHCLLEGHPNSDLSKFINVYKSASSRLIKKEFPDVRNKLWKNYFWSRSFCLITVGGAPLEVLKKYIDGQRR
jgi:REP-associated tyrosine transposase